MPPTLVREDVLCDVVECMEGDGLPRTLMCVKGGSSNVQVPLCRERREQVVLELNHLYSDL